MPARPPRPLRPPRAWRPLLAAAALYTAVVIVTVAVRTAGADRGNDYDAVRARSTSDFRDYWWTAREFRQTGQVTTDYGVHNYLPAFAILMLPWSFLPLPLAAALFALLSLALFAVSALLAEELLSDSPRSGPRPALGLAVVLALPYVHSCAVLGNIGLLLAFLIVSTWFLVERGREWEAGIALGLAAVLKLLPALLILFFLIKRRWRVAGAALGIAALLALGLPLATLGPAATRAQLADFQARAVRDHAAWRTITADKPPKGLYGNSALPMVLRRLLTPLNAGPDDADHRLFVNVADLPRPAVLATYAALIAAFGGVSLAAAAARPRRFPPETVEAGRAVRAQYGAWCCLMLLASPLLWVHYLPLAYWPLAWASDHVLRAHRAHRPGRWLSTAVLALWIAAAVLLAWPTARAAGAQLVAIAALWVLLVSRCFASR